MQNEITPKSILDKESSEKKEARSPVIVVMGHVDHGKTTFLDYVRKMSFEAVAKNDASKKNSNNRLTSVADREAGGITQAVGAYEVIHNNRKITFIDTPGHEAFSAMRSRGALIADLAILIVAADEGVKPQTKEAIKILEETKTPFIVAINKIDRVNGNLEKAKNDLLTAGVLLEGLGGQISYHGISAKTGEGIDELLDLILLTSDIEGFKYDPQACGSGYILEVRRDPRRGIEVIVIVKDGILKRGDNIFTSSSNGVVKILEDFAGNSMESISPSAPAIIIGFDSLPNIGDKFFSGNETSDIYYKNNDKLKSADEIIKNQTIKKVGWASFILKASDSGSLEALSMTIGSIAIEKRKNINIIEGSVGDITDSDVRKASATSAVIIAFKNRIEKSAQNLIESQHILVISSNIIYDIKKEIEDYLLSEGSASTSGALEVLAVFNQKSLTKQLIGGLVTSGIFRAKSSFEIFKNVESREPIGNGKILTLRENKTEINQAEKGKEIGVFASCQIKIEIGNILVVKK